MLCIMELKPILNTQMESISAKLHIFHLSVPFSQPISLGKFVVIFPLYSLAIFYFPDLKIGWRSVETWPRFSFILIVSVM